MHRIMLGWFATVFVMLAAACSSSDDDEGGSAACKARCDAEATASCGSSHEACLSNCNQSHATLAAQCGGEFDTATNCLSSVAWVCNSSGSAMTEDPHACLAEAQALMKCGTCIPTDSQGPCYRCAQERCCKELSAFADEPTFVDYLRCQNACNDDFVCSSYCKKDYPVMKELDRLATECAEIYCPAECS